MAPHSSTLAWKIPWTEEHGGLQSMGSLRVGHDWATSLSLFTFMHWGRKWEPTPVFLPGESQGWGSLVGCHLWGHTVGHDWSDLAAAAAVYILVSHALVKSKTILILSSLTCNFFSWKHKFFCEISNDVPWFGCIFICCVGPFDLENMYFNYGKFSWITYLIIYFFYSLCFLILKFVIYTLSY